MTVPLEFVWRLWAACTSFVSSTFASFTALPETLSVTMTVYRTGMRLSSSWRQAERKMVNDTNIEMRIILCMGTPVGGKFSKKSLHKRATGYFRFPTESPCQLGTE